MDMDDIKTAGEMLESMRSKLRLLDAMAGCLLGRVEFEDFFDDEPAGPRTQAATLGFQDLTQDARERIEGICREDLRSSVEHTAERLRYMLLGACAPAACDVGTPVERPESMDQGPAA